MLKNQEFGNSKFKILLFQICRGLSKILGINSCKWVVLWVAIIFFVKTFKDGHMWAGAFGRSCSVSRDMQQWG